MKTLLRPFGGGLACDDPDKNVFDIHGGGIDLVFPHHENEIAQSCCAFGSQRMANVWMHNGFLQVEGEKMSKSLGNFVTIHELLRTDKFGGRAWPGAVLRFAMLRTHYRQPIDWTVRALEESEKALQRFAEIAAAAETPAAAPSVGVARRARRRSQHAGRDRASARARPAGARRRERRGAACAPTPNSSASTSPRSDARRPRRRSTREDRARIEALIAERLSRAAREGLGRRPTGCAPNSKRSASR